MLRLLTLALIAAMLATGAADAKTLRWANRGDPQTTDPHSQNEGLTNNVNQLVYEFLVGRDKKLDLVPELAVSWTQVSPRSGASNCVQSSSSTTARRSPPPT